MSFSITRRSSVLFALAGAFSNSDMLLAEAQTPAPPPAPAAPPAPPTVQPPIVPVTEALLYATVHLEFPVPGGMRTGTGFAFAFFNSEGRSFLSIVSNKHVFADSEIGSFRVTRAKHDGKPDTGNTITIQMPDLSKSVIKHPSVDLAIYPISQAMNELQSRGEKIFLSPMDQTLIPDTKTLQDLSALQQVVSIGYPGQLWDNVNYVPLFHRGYTASPAYFDFQGRKEFAIDIATWPGASGSPILVLDQGSIFNEKTNSMAFGGTRLLLLGVAYGVATQEVEWAGRICSGA